MMGFRALSEDSGVAGEGERDAVAVADDEDMVVSGREELTDDNNDRLVRSCQCLVLSVPEQHAM